MSKLLFVLAVVLFLVAMFLILFNVHETRALDMLLYGGLAAFAGGFAIQ